MMATGTTSESTEHEVYRRKILAATVGAIIQECGFHKVEKAAAGVLTEMLQSLIVEIGKTSKMFCEVAYRSEPIIADIILSFSELGINTDVIQAYAKRGNRIVISHPGQHLDTKQNGILQVGDKKALLPHIPDYLPPFPDTHTYCFSHTYKQPVTEYEAIRERSAVQKRDIEKALIKFSTKTTDTANLFNAEDKESSLIAVKATAMPFHDALMPRDQVFEEDEIHLASLNRRKKEENDRNGENKEKDKDQVDSEVDNPYLRAVKLPRKRNRKHTN